MLRGDVYRLRLAKGSGHEQHGERFGVILQGNDFLPRSLVVVAPTSRSARGAILRPEVQVGGEPTRVLIEQLRAIDANRLGKKAGHLQADEIWEIDEAVRTFLDLN